MEDKAIKQKERDNGPKLDVSVLFGRIRVSLSTSFEKSCSHAGFLLSRRPLLVSMGMTTLLGYKNGWYCSRSEIEKRVEFHVSQVTFEYMSARLKTICLVQERIPDKSKLLEYIVDLFLTLAHYQGQWQPTHAWIISHTAL